MVSFIIVPLILVAPVILMPLILMSPVILMSLALVSPLPLIVFGMIRICSVFIIMAVAYPLLVVPAPVTAILTPVLVMLHPWRWVIDHNFITMVYIIPGITGWQAVSSYPTASFEIYIYMVRHIVIGIYIGYIIIVDIIIANWPPYRLNANVDMNLCVSRITETGSHK